MIHVTSDIPYSEYENTVERSRKWGLSLIYNIITTFLCCPMLLFNLRNCNLTVIFIYIFIQLLLIYFWKFQSLKKSLYKFNYKKKLLITFRLVLKEKSLSPNFFI